MCAAVEMGAGGLLYLENLVVEGIQQGVNSQGLTTGAGGSGTNRTLLANKVAWTK